jgi:hypothetical protein
MSWRIHWLEADADLSPWRDRIAAEVEATRDVVARVVTPPRLDILVERASGMVIPEIGMVGRAYRKALFALAVDPDNANFARCLQDGTLRRQVAHEVHHCMRMGAIGYGRTLGEVLVSEGLAGRFAGHLFDSPPEPWECAVDDAALRAHLPDATALSALDYDHMAWFFGAKGLYPRWLAYTLGYRIVGDWLATQTEVDGEVWIGVPATVVLAAARGRTLTAA